LKILLVRPRLIGDVLLTTPLLGALRRRFPDAEIAYVLEALAAPVLEAHPHVSTLITLHHRRGWRRWREDALTARRLRSEGFAVAVDLHGGARSALLTWASRAPVRVGYDGAGRGWMYTHVVRRPRGYQPRHSVLNQWDLLRPIDPAFGADPTPDLHRVAVAPPADPRKRAADLTAGLGIATGSQVVLMHVAAGNRFRQWSSVSFAAVATSLAAADRNRWIVLLGGPGDRSLVDEVRQLAQAQAGDEGRRIVAAVGWSLGDVRATLEHAALFIGGDSGPMHMAATTDVPIVAIFGPTLPATWAPWRPGHLPLAIVDSGPLPCRPCDQRVCAPGDHRCLTAIPADHVIEAALRLLARPS
jgi:lipopolysaccharide heptosyltransferase II